MSEKIANLTTESFKQTVTSAGTWRAGEHYGVKRIPVIKKQAISAYDPRVVEVYLGE